MAKPRITQTQLKELLDYDPLTGIFTRRTDFIRYIPTVRWRKGDIAKGTKINGYTYIGVAGGQMYAHQLAWLTMYGELPVWPEVIDHIDGDKSNNCISNLRKIHSGENAQNRHRANRGSTSAFLGVSYSKRRQAWISQISAGPRGAKRAHYLGQFSTEAHAHAAYVAAKRKLHPFGEL